MLQSTAWRLLNIDLSSNMTYSHIVSNPMRPKTSIAPRRPEPGPGRRERHRAEIRERLFRAALRLFAERGYQETTVEAITEAADVGKGTFFNYFPTKEHVLATFGDERIAAIERAAEEARKHKGPVLPLIRHLTTDLAGQSSESAALLRSIYAAHASCLPVRAELQKRLRKARRLMAEMLAVGQQQGEIRRNLSAADLARLIQLIFHGVTLSWALNPDAELRATTEDVWGLIAPALAARSK
jgi:AcrR family transcriptional regulator